MKLIDAIMAHPVRTAIGALALAIVASSTFTVVPETKQAIILNLGQFNRVVNAYQPGQRYGLTGAGLVARIPFLEQVQLIDKRVLGVELDDQPVLSTDQLRILVDAYARFRVVNPRRMYESIGTTDRLRDQLRSLLSSSLRNELGRRTFASMLSPERSQVMTSIQQALSQEATRYGAEIIDVRINRAELPEGDSRDAVFNRMRTARQQEATAIEAEGQKDAQIIRAEADAEAARIYAASFGKDPQFYAFYRAMQSYEQTFTGRDAGPTTFVLPPGEGYLSQFDNR